MKKQISGSTLATPIRMARGNSLDKLNLVTFSSEPTAPIAHYH